MSRSERIWAVAGVVLFEAFSILLGATAAWLLIALAAPHAEVVWPWAHPLSWWDCAALSTVVCIVRYVWRAVFRRGAR